VDSVETRDHEFAIRNAFNSGMLAAHFKHCELFFRDSGEIAAANKNLEEYNRLIKLYLLENI